MSAANIRSEDVAYSSGETEMRGYLAWDDSIEGSRPGILVVHEWWGLNDFARRRADALAALGYTAMAVDMYGGGQTADNPDQAGALMNAVIEDMETGRARFKAALDTLHGHATVNAGQIGAIGYCFGGGVVLHMARVGMDLGVVVSFHGSLPLAITPGVDQMAARVVAYNGEADPFVPAEDIAQFQEEMASAGAHCDFIQLPGAEHAFTNPEATAKGEKYGIPLKYDELADQVSWGHMQMVFREVFGA